MSVGTERRICRSWRGTVNHLETLTIGPYQQMGVDLWMPGKIPQYRGRPILWYRSSAHLCKPTSRAVTKSVWYCDAFWRITMLSCTAGGKYFTVRHIASLPHIQQHPMLSWWTGYGHVYIGLRRGTLSLRGGGGRRVGNLPQYSEPNHGPFGPWGLRATEAPSYIYLQYWLYLVIFVLLPLLKQ